jgi:hypothetical protein
MSRTILLLLVLFTLSGVEGLLAAEASAQSRTVVVNGARVPEATLQALEARYGVQAQEGAYWYDPACGAWGFDGGPTIGYLPVGLPVSPALHPDASRGRTNVWVNGRRLPADDLRAVEALTGPVMPGRYWLDAQGYAGVEGGPATVNLFQLAQRAGGGGTFYRSGNTGYGSGSSGGTSYVMGSDWSVIVD